VLQHPDMLRGAEAMPEYLLFLSDFYAGADYNDSASVHGQLCGLFGLQIFQDRFFSRLPLPLPKEYGRYYGFNLDLYAYMDHHGGSATDPHQYTAAEGQRAGEYRLASKLEPGFQALRAAIPSGARVVVGQTPLPESFVPRDFGPKYQAMMRQWGEWIKADALLTNVPPSLPDKFFATTTHLNESGALY